MRIDFEETCDYSDELYDNQSLKNHLYKVYMAGSLVLTQAVAIDLKYIIRLLTKNNFKYSLITHSLVDRLVNLYFRGV